MPNDLHLSDRTTTLSYMDDKGLMKIRIGKAFLEEVKIRSGGNTDERAQVLTALLLRATQTKTGVSVEVDETELNHLIDECEWYVYNNSPEDSSDDRKNFNNLCNQLKAFNKAKQ